MRMGVVKPMVLIYNGRLSFDKLCYFATIDYHHTLEDLFKKNEYKDYRYEPVKIILCAEAATYTCLWRAYCA
jgi:hypothetical protein